MRYRILGSVSSRQNENVICRGVCEIERIYRLCSRICKKKKEVFDMSKKMSGIIHFFVMVALYFIVSMLPPFGMVTPMGMKILGAFVAIVYGWIFMDLLFASVFGFLFLGMTGVFTPATAVSAGFSNQTVQTIIIIGAFAAGDKADADFSHRPHEKWVLFGMDDLDKNQYGLKSVGRKLMAEGKTPPIVYHACGEFDPWKDMNDLMRDFFTSYPGDPFHYHYDVLEGYGHQWEFCDIEVQKFLDYLGVVKKS